MVLVVHNHLHVFLLVIILWNSVKGKTKNKLVFEESVIVNLPLKSKLMRQSLVVQIKRKYICGSSQTWWGYQWLTK